MKEKEQAILARDMIGMIREYSDNADVLEYLESFASSIAQIVDDGKVINWFDLAGICDQRYYSLLHNKHSPLNIELLDKCEQQIKPYLAQADE